MLRFRITISATMLLQLRHAELMCVRISEPPLFPNSRCLLPLAFVPFCAKFHSCFVVNPHHFFMPFDQSFHRVPVLEPVNRSSSVFHHLLLHFFCLVFECVFEFPRAGAAPIRVASFIVWFQVYNEAVGVISFSIIFCLRFAYLFRISGIACSLQFGSVCHCVSIFPHVQFAFPLLFSMMPFFTNACLVMSQ